MPNPEGTSEPAIEGVALILAFQESNDNDIATVLLKQYQPMVKMAANKISRNHPELYEDLFQIGQMAMFRLFSQYDVNVGLQFEPYAMKSIIGHTKIICVIKLGMCKCQDGSKKRVS